MADVNSNPNEKRTGGPAASSTGAPAQTEQPDSQKGSAANAIGDKDKKKHRPPEEASQGGGKQPNDPVQHN